MYQASSYVGTTLGHPVNSKHPQLEWQFLLIKFPQRVLETFQPKSVPECTKYSDKSQASSVLRSQIIVCTLGADEMYPCSQIELKSINNCNIHKIFIHL